MIQIEHTGVHGWEAAIRGMRNPLNNWDKSDSYYCPKFEFPGDEHEEGCCNDDYCIGHADLELMRRLANAGPDHGKFLRMIDVTCDITAPLYFWSEYDTYKVGTVANSCSKMHTLHWRELTLDDFSHDHLTPRSELVLEDIIADLNYSRKLYNETGNKEHWWQMIQLLPSSYNQRRTVHLNYAVLRAMHKQRKAHKLDEWRGFCRWIEGLPYAAELIVEQKKEETSIVRCKDCVHYSESGDCDVHPHDGRFSVNYFCADGERKEA